MRIDPGFEQMYRAEYGSVFRAVYLLCGDRAMAEDATQEAFARGLERWRRIEGRSWATGWIVTTALNITRQALRRRPLPVMEGPPRLRDLSPSRSGCVPQQQVEGLGFRLDDRSFSVSVAFGEGSPESLRATVDEGSGCADPKAAAPEVGSYFQSFNYSGKGGFGFPSETFAYGVVWRGVAGITMTLDDGRVLTSETLKSKALPPSGCEPTCGLLPSPVPPGR
jgi:hypothetical protein